MAQVEHLLARAIADDLGLGEDSLRPRLASAAALAALTAIGKRRDADADDGDADASARDAIDEALSFARAGLDALRRLP